MNNVQLGYQLDEIEYEKQVANYGGNKA